MSRPHSWLSGGTLARIKVLELPFRVYLINPTKRMFRIHGMSLSLDLSVSSVSVSLWV